ncbi:MAG: tRNA pseudouridine(55) synthase TruB [Caldilineaceae bacterium]
MSELRQTNQTALHGLLVVDKPGIEELSTQTSHSDERPPWLPTSHDIVNRVRRWSGEKRIGHTGTLDPMASGVLVLTIGNATRLTEYYQGHDKRYFAEIQLGAATDTYDRTGKVTERATVPELTLATIETVLAQFRGNLMQKPPAFSAIKQDGKTAYQQARKGHEVELEARPVTIYQMDLVEFCAPDRLRVTIHCSTGTYIRSLAYDIGRTMGTVGLLNQLRRLAVGNFMVERAHTLPEIEAAAKAGTLDEWLLPSGYGLALPVVQLDPTATQRLGFGQKVRLPVDWFSPVSLAGDSPHVDDTPSSATIRQGTLAQAIAADGQLVGIISCTVAPQEHSAVWRAEKWFVDSQLVKDK